MPEPTHGRVPQDDGSHKTLIMSVGKKKLHADGPDNELSRMMYGSMTLNGVQYCRRHLVLSCHLCQTEYTPLKEEADSERLRVGLRPAGDPMLNRRSAQWKEFITDKQMEQTLQRELLIQKYGKNHARTHPQHWIELTNKLGKQEKEINDRFLPEVDEIKKRGASQCCYWRCTSPTGMAELRKLSKCAGCGIAKYCCKEHQLLDWKWEHKGECTKNLPDWLVAEYERDRVCNLAGDYKDYKD